MTPEDPGPQCHPTDHGLVLGWRTTQPEGHISPLAGMGSQKSEVRSQPGNGGFLGLPWMKVFQACVSSSLVQVRILTDKNSKQRHTNESRISFNESRNTYSHVSVGHFMNRPDRVS